MWVRFEATHSPDEITAYLAQHCRGYARLLRTIPHGYDRLGERSRVHFPLSYKLSDLRARFRYGSAKPMKTRYLHQRREFRTERNAIFLDERYFPRYVWFNDHTDAIRVKLYLA